MSKQKTGKKGVYYPGTTAEVFENWLDPNCHSTMQRVFGTITQLRRELAASNKPVTTERIMNLKGFKEYCNKRGDLRMPDRQTLACRISEEWEKLSFNEQFEIWPFTNSHHRSLALEA